MSCIQRKPSLTLIDSIKPWPTPETFLCVHGRARGYNKTTSSPNFFRAKIFFDSGEFSHFKLSNPDTFKHAPVFARRYDEPASYTF